MSVRNPNYPDGATMTRLVVENAGMPFCRWCGREGDLSKPENHDGYCPHPFMDAADQEIGWLRWALQVIFRYWMLPPDKSKPDEKDVYTVLANFHKDHNP